MVSGCRVLVYTWYMDNRRLTWIGAKTILKRSHGIGSLMGGVLPTRMVDSIVSGRMCMVVDGAVEEMYTAAPESG